MIVGSDMSSEDSFEAFDMAFERYGLEQAVAEGAAEGGEGFAAVGELVEEAQHQIDDGNRATRLAERVAAALGLTFGQQDEVVAEEVAAEQVRLPPASGASAKNRFEMLLSTKEHEMHHRAQLMVIQRLLGIVPHLTRNRQARAADAAPARA